MAALNISGYLIANSSIDRANCRFAIDPGSNPGWRLMSNHNVLKLVTTPANASNDNQALVRKAKPNGKKSNRCPGLEHIGYCDFVEFPDSEWVLSMDGRHLVKQSICKHCNDTEPIWRRVYNG